MKPSLIAFSVLSFFTTALCRADEYSFKESFKRTGTFNSTGAITLENVNGSIDVRTWDKNEILIEVAKSAETEEELKLIDLAIDLSESRAGIKVRLPKRTDGFSPKGNIRAEVRFKLTVPADAVLEKITTVNSTVTLDGVHGAVNASSVNGGVSATGLGGSAKLSTVNGPIKADFSNVAAQQKLSFTTVNGGVLVRLPKDAGFEFHGATLNGRVNCDFPLTLGGAARGHIVSGTIGDGRASLNAGTVNGGISIESH